ncbi:GNAT family N-acetyltransferase [Streptomyces sp. SID13031]|uniref:GNAT family N-acetyltransferase n=1 Tax=Streptomyces sp. SID13031 TaxID=2706046 RepID=UPI0013C9DC6C|nr:GNAT family N-acetyltransferase [Streptomyces sp. SID13031]NEA30801.1 GNAT family N-acetyltransferase [Streptomyces sp. SID13031]
MDLVELAEVVEANLMFKITAIEPSLLERLGITGRRFGRGIALSLRNDPSQYWSRVQGLGLDGPVTAELIGEVVDFHRAAGTPAAHFHLPPAVLPADWDDIRETYGLEPGGTIVKLLRDDAPVEPAESSLRIGPVDPADSDGHRAWADIQILAFEMPDPEGLLAEMLAALTVVPGFQAYGAWDGDKLVATGGLYVEDEVGECVSASTLPEYRGRGAQSALIARRVQDALAAGCKWVSTETGKPAEGEQNPSLDNMQRAGFKPLYDRQSWVWRP